MNFKKWILLAALPLGAASFSFSEGMREIIADYEGRELYAGPSGTWVPDIFVSGNVNVERIIDDPLTPEGRKLFRIHHQASLVPSSWGVYYDAPRDFSAFSNGDIRFWLRNPDQKVLVYMKSVTEAGVEVEWFLGAANPNANMRELVAILAQESPLPEGSPRPNGFDFARITVPFMVLTAPSAGTTYDVDHVRWTKIPTSIKVFPAFHAVQPGKKRQVTVEAYDAAGHFIAIPTTFTVTGASSMNPTHPILAYQSVLTAGSTGGTVTATKRKEAALPESRMVLTSQATLTSLEGSHILGLLSETAPLSLNLLGEDSSPSADSRFDLFADDPSRHPVVSDDSIDYVEGNFSLKTTVHLTADDQWTGWTIRWGREDNALNSLVRNMSIYYEGTIRFWFKGPPELASALTVGIRSGNVPAGLEVSKDLLSKYVTFDNQWHPVAIPLQEWARSRPFADLSRIKHFFTLSLAGNTNGPQTFFIDNLRWDDATPGALVSIRVAPHDIMVPLGTRRIFTATGYDATGAIVDISPMWDMPGNALGTLAPHSNRTLLIAADSPVDGTLRACVSDICGQTSVRVQEIVFTQQFNVYSDAGIPEHPLVFRWGLVRHPNRY
jgi:hypothetical protein